MDGKTNEQALKMFQTLCGVLDAKELNYEADQEKLYVEFGGTGDDLPMHFVITVDAQRDLVILYSSLPFATPEEQIIPMALAIMFINDSLLDGCFDLDVSDGRICFRETNTFRGSLLSAEAIDYMISYSIYVVDEYNDKLLMLSKDAISLGDFIEGESQE